MGPYKIVVQSSQSSETRLEGSNFAISYSLPWSLLFLEPHFARLLFVGGYSKGLFVFADFVELQYVNGKVEPFLGCSSTSAVNTWVPLASTHIPSIGYLHVRSAKGRTPADLGDKLNIVIEIASNTWINGASGSA
jgi:hypothetical protein